MEWLYLAAGVFFAWAAFARAELWLERFINAQQRQADGLHNVAGALLKRIEWEATCRRADKAEADARAVQAEIDKRRRPPVIDDSALAPEAQSLLSKLRARPAPSPDVLYPKPKPPEAT